MAQPPRTPPRFVPTLTEVVQVPGATPTPGAPAAPARTTVVAPSQLPPLTRPGTPAAAPAVQVPKARPPLPSAQPPAVMAQRPAITPTAPTAATLPPPAAGAGLAARRAAPSFSPPLPSVGPAPAAPATHRPLPEGMEEYMVHRVMQRVDGILEQRLRDAIATVVQEQTRSVLPRLREEIESVVRHTVYEAVADELTSGAPLVSKG